MIRLLALLVWCVAAVPAAAQEVLTLGFLGLENDPRYDADRVYARIELRPRGDPLEGVRMAIEDMRTVTDVVGLDIEVDARKAADAPGLLAAAEEMAGAGVPFIVLDLPAEQAGPLAEALEGQDITLLNATAPDMGLRTVCHANLLHTAASDRMTADAMVQFLRRQDWTRVLMLVGKAPRDAAIAEAFRNSAERLRIEIVDERLFDLSTSPDDREENNIRLLTGSRPEYDVVYLADSDGEFGRYVPYQTTLPRPVLGTTGLTAVSWHWSLERYGAPQVNSRFESGSDGRRMVWQDWSAWIAARAVITAVARTPGNAPAAAAEYLRSDRMRVDGSMGVGQNFRTWNGQMRMPILLVTHNAIIDIAPLDGFEHRSNTLDTLGTDEQEFQCE